MQFAVRVKPQSQNEMMIRAISPGSTKEKKMRRKMTDRWQEQEAAERPDKEEDVQLQILMRNAKRYIRSIDIRRL
jgi:hypothetical protein